MLLPPAPRSSPPTQPVPTQHSPPALPPSGPCCHGLRPQVAPLPPVRTSGLRLNPPFFNNPFSPFPYLIISDILRNTHSDLGLGRMSSAPRPCTCPSLSHGHCFSTFSRLTPSTLHSVVLGHWCLIRLLGLPLSYILGHSTSYSIPISVCSISLYTCILPTPCNLVLKST